MDSTLAWMSPRGWCAWGLLAAIASGCASPFSNSYLSGSRQQEAVQPQTAVDPVAAANDPTAVALRKANGQEPETPQEALAGVLDELEEIRAIDPAAQQQVMADLKDAKPEHYALIVSQFKAALSYRRQLAEREMVERTQLTSSDIDDHAHGPALPRARIVSRTARRADAVQVVEPMRRDVVPGDEVQVAVSDDEATAVAADEPDTSRRDRAVQPATAALPLAAGDWRANLDATIAELEHSVNPRPETVAELHDHLRLRALQLVAGREEEAYRPIPGASSAQQDYWSKQLFAMGAYLKGDGPMDEKQRAAAALVHLDDARSSLAQLATLQIRNLAFVEGESVTGFGAYEPLKHAEFQPGDQVTIYAEVENFGSTAGASGYETTLGTSYQVLDSGDRRVEGGQFQDVSDSCRGRRRDFHLQYGISLPSRIYPGEYRIELTITDQHTGKIGHASLPFEIVAP